MIAQLALCGIALAAPPRLTPALVRETDAAGQTLRAAVTLGSRADVERVEAAMRVVRRGVDAYFHAPNLLKARPVALAMRGVMRRLRADPDPVLRVVDDVLRFAPALHDRLAAACAALKDADCTRRHRLLAWVSGPTPARRAAADATLEAAERTHLDAAIKAATAPASRPE